MSRTVTLLANLGAEERMTANTVPVSPAQRSAAQLWRCLFANERAAFLNKDLQQRWHWPQLLGPPAPEPAFAGLTEEAGLVPWLSTKHAHATARELGKAFVAPDPSIVALVHDKAFAVQRARQLHLEPAMLEDLAVTFDPLDLQDPAEIVDKIQRTVRGWPTRFGRRFTLKPRFGCSGRGRVPGSTDDPDSVEIRGALPRLARCGGAILEPWLQRTTDLSAQFLVSKEGNIQLLGTLRQVLSVSGSYFGHCGRILPNGDIVADTPYDTQLLATSLQLVQAAHSAGYWGPCGVDAFVFEDGDHVVFRPAVELNARFTLGTIALGLVRRARHLGNAANSDAAGGVFYFGLNPPGSGWPAVSDNNPHVRMLPLWSQQDRCGPGILFGNRFDDLGLPV